MYTTIPRHLYIHIPFCASKCPYCAFYSTVYSGMEADQYLMALETEIRMTTDLLPGRLAPRTVFIGGGTPSVLSPRQLEQLGRLLHRSVDMSQLEEWTCEANPSSLSPDTLAALVRIGVTRISLGIQSLDDHMLRQLGRGHTRDMATQAVERIRRLTTVRIALDLIIGMAGTSARNAADAALAATDLHPDHISTYLLSCEAGTPFAARAAAGQAVLVEEENQLAQISAAADTLVQRGFPRYEISNFARPGQRCLHNQNTWQGGDYLGFGPAAASRCATHRWQNHPSLDGYLRSLRLPQLPPRTAEILDARTDASERMAFCIRMCDGLSIPEWAGKLTLPPEHLADHLQRVLAPVANAGLIDFDNGTWRLTANGYNMADTISEVLLDSLPATFPAGAGTSQ